MKFTKQAADDLEFWKQSNASVVKRIKLLLADIEAHPYIRAGQAGGLEA